MNTYNDIVTQLAAWQASGKSKVEIVTALAEACIGWPYVWGGYGQKCTRANREAYAGRSTCPSAESEVIRKKCQQLGGGKGSCAGCKWYPGDATLFFDCRGFTRWTLGKVGVSVSGAGATSQWNTAGNWSAKGSISEIPDKICCVFIRNGNTMSHTGLYIGGGWVIHCSGEVKKELLSKGKWTHYAVPKGLDGGVDPVPTTDKPTIRKGSRGEYVTLLQAKLIQLGYDLSPYGADGAFGNKTLVAVKAFQQDRGLTADGIVGPKTWAALDEVPDQFPKKSTYSVTIHGLDLTQARALQANYPGSDLKEE